jgi:hypothetical protein
MAIVSFPDSVFPFSASGAVGFGSGYGASEYGKMRYGFSDFIVGVLNYGAVSYGTMRKYVVPPFSGIYQRKLVGLGSTLAPRQQAGRWGISRMKFYRPAQTLAETSRPMLAIYGAGVGAWRGLTTIQKAQYSKQARNLNMSGYNLFMSNWLQSRRS